MDRESEYLFCLLGAYVRGEAPGGADGMELEKLKHLASIHSVDGIFCPMAMRHGLFPAERGAFRAECMAVIGGYAKRAALAEMLFEEMTRRGMDHLLMKGYVVKDYYPVPELRTYGDIDVLIRADDRQKCHDLMVELGFEVKSDWEPVYSYVRVLEFYELHTQLLETDISAAVDCRDYFSDPWAHVSDLGGHRYQFTPEYHFLYLLAHLAKHVAASGAGARMYLDLAAFILHFGADADWSRIEKELEKTGLAAFANTALAFVERYFKVKSPLELSPVGDDTLEALADLTAEGGVFGRFAVSGGTVTLRNEAEGAGRMAAIRRRLFPAAKTIESRYTYLQKRPWLLPVAWVHRVVRTWGKLGGHAAAAKDILSADEAEVKRLRRMLREIGL